MAFTKDNKWLNNVPKNIEQKRAYWRKYTSNRWKTKLKRKFPKKPVTTKQDKKEYINSLKLQPCSDCSSTYPPYVMHFDHLPERGQKKFGIAKGWSKPWDVLKEELAKCELVCANCHAIRTHNRRAERRLVKAS